MKILEVKRNESWNYVVSLKYNWFEKIFGHKDGEYEFKSTGHYYPFTGLFCYITKEGVETSNSSSIARAIDKFRRKW